MSWTRMIPHATFVLATVCALSGGAMAEARLADPRDAARAFMEATAAGDAAAIASLYTLDAILLMPNAPVVAGRDSIRAVHEHNASLGKVSIVFRDIRIQRGTDHAVVLWVWLSEIRPASGAPVRTLGRSLVYFRKQPDGWFISADMMQPAPGGR